MRHLRFMLACALLAMPGLLLAQDQGMTGETHRKNVGKILWAGERIKKDMQDSISYKNSFNAGDPLYGRVFLPKSLALLSKEKDKPGACQNSSSRYELKLFMGGKDMGAFHSYWLDYDWTTVQINLALSPGDGVDDRNQGVPEKWAKVVNGLPKGSHQVKVEFLGGLEGCEMRKYAEGSFTLVKSGDAELDPNKQALPAALMNDPALESSMIAAVKARGWKNETPVKVVIIEPEWRLIRDVFGTITHREINTITVLKVFATGKCRATDISFRQPYLGGKYGGTEVYGIGMKNFTVDCP